MAYYSETDKIRDILNPKYLEGKVVDIGCADHKIKPDAIGVDGRLMDGVDIALSSREGIYHLSAVHFKDIHNCDAVFSSHCLEHLKDDYAALDDWYKIIKKGGYLILYLPDGRYYNNKENEEHFRDYTYEGFMFFFQRAFCGDAKDYEGNYYPPYFRLIESGLDIGNDKYSFYIVAQKL